MRHIVGEATSVADDQNTGANCRPPVADGGIDLR